MSRRLAAGIELGIAFAVGLYVAYYSGSAVQYIVFGLASGDWLNDWLTHLPAFVQSVAQHLMH